MFAIEAVYHNHIGTAAHGFDEVGAVGFHQFKRVAFGGDFEHGLGNGDDLRVDFHHGLQGGWAKFGQPTGKRATAQTDLGDVGWRVLKQQPAHHGLAVRQDQFAGVIEIHRRLYGRAAQMQ